MRWKWFLAGFVALPIAAALCGWIVLKLRSDGFSARTPPSAIEAAVALRVRNLAIPDSAASLANPVADSPEVLAEARAHWADHCATCHANDGSGDALMGRRTWPPAPDMRRPATQQLTDGELFYIIQN